MKIARFKGLLKYNAKYFIFTIITIILTIKYYVVTHKIK